MLAVVGSSGSRLHANSVAYCLSRAWGAAGRRVLLVDADTSGSALYERLGEATSRRYAPQRRGLPSLMASRTPLTAATLAAHSYQTAGDGSVWILLGPRHIEGGALAAGWLAERFEDLVSIDAERTVVVAASLLIPDTRITALLSQVPAAAVVAPVGSGEALAALRDELHGAGLLTGDSRRSLRVVVEGDSSLCVTDLAETLAAEAAGRLRVVSDAAVLRSPQRRRGRFAKSVGALAASLEPHITAELSHGRDQRAEALDVGGWAPDSASASDDPGVGKAAVDPVSTGDGRRMGSVPSAGARLRRRLSSQHGSAGALQASGGWWLP